MPRTRIDRRQLLSLFGAAAASRPLLAQPSGGVGLYASIGSELVHYELDAGAATLVRRGAVTLPANVQYGWPHPSRRFLYVAASNGGPGVAGDFHRAQAFRIDPATGVLQPHGGSVTLASRPIHLTTDIPGRHVLIAYNNPSALTVHRIEPDATLGQEVRPAVPLDAGIYGHQVRVARSNRTAILVARGNDATNDRREDPGALKTFRFDAGRLTSQASIAPQGGFGFGPRHLDFHPSQPWVFVSLERQNQIWVFRMDGDALHPEPLFKVDTLARPGKVQPRQLAGTIHVHPNGRFVYGANRADGTTDPGGSDAASLGENSIAVYAIDQRTGGLTPIQHADTRGIHARTFHIDPSGRILVAAHIRPLQLREGAATRVVPASLSVFRIGGDGTLDYVRKYNVEVGALSMFWMGMVGGGN